MFLVEGLEPESCASQLNGSDEVHCKVARLSIVLAAAVAVAQSVEHPFKGPSKKRNSLTDASLNPGRGIKW